MQFENIFTTKIDLPTPPQTPLGEEIIFEESSLDQEVFSLNFTLQDLVNDVSTTNDAASSVLLSDDFMWGNSLQSHCRSATATPTLDKKLRERSLITPLHFYKTNVSSNDVQNNCDMKSSQESWLGYETLLTPAEGESDGEIDVVGDTFTEQRVQPFTIEQTRPSSIILTFSSANQPVSEKSSQVISVEETSCAAETARITESPRSECLLEKVFPETTHAHKVSVALSKGKRKASVNTTKNESLSSDELSSDTSPRPVHRSSHNNLERKRRDELKRKFDDLKQSIPDIAQHGKTAKVVVLKKAMEYIADLNDMENQLMHEKQLAEAMYAILTRKLDSLTNRRDNLLKFFY